MVDLRSDTVTRPVPAMRRAMADAEVGDDVYGEDPTVQALQREAAAAVGFEAALFVPSGTMANQIAVNLLSRHGTEVIVEAGSHVYNYELAAMAAWSGALPRVLVGREGVLDVADVAEAARAKPYYHAPVTLLVVENSHNHAGGTVVELAQSQALLRAARGSGISAHLDGARIFNAAAALGVAARDLAAGFDSVMFCFSKGLGAPVGSVFCGSEDLVREARVVRKRMGGGMRQAGVIAAAARYALAHHVDRLAEDHARARRLADALASHRTFRLDPERVRTNIVIAEVVAPRSVDEVLDALKREGVLAGSMGVGRVRFVTHLDVDDAGIDRALSALRAL